MMSFQTRAKVLRSPSKSSALSSSSVHLLTLVSTCDNGHISGHRLPCEDITPLSWLCNGSDNYMYWGQQLSSAHPPSFVAQPYRNRSTFTLDPLKWRVWARETITITLLWLHYSCHHADVSLDHAVLCGYPEETSSCGFRIELALIWFCLLSHLIVSRASAPHKVGLCTVVSKRQTFTHCRVLTRCLHSLALLFLVFS